MEGEEETSSWRHLSKRKIDDALSTLDDAGKHSAQSTKKQKQSRLRSTISTPALVSLLALHKPQPRPQPAIPPSYDPTSLSALLSRLSTYRLTTYSPKPPSLSPPTAARHGWSNSPQRERLECVTCHKAFLVTPPSSKEGGWNGPLGKRMEGEYGRLLNKEGHEEACPWRMRGCARGLYACRTEGRGKILEEMVKGARETTGRIGAKEVGEMSIKHPLTEEEFNKLVQAAQDSKKASDLQWELPPAPALVLALFGWSAATSSTPTSPIITCSLCTREVLINSYLPSSTTPTPTPSTPSQYFDLISQHQKFCPYVDSLIPPSSSSSSTTPSLSNSTTNRKRTGWQARLDTVVTRPRRASVASVPGEQFTWSDNRGGSETKKVSAFEEVGEQKTLLHLQLGCGLPILRRLPDHIAYENLKLTDAGSSTFNIMVFNRAFAADYDAWRLLGNPGWSATFTSVLSRNTHSRENFVPPTGNNLNVTPSYDIKYHGIGGPVQASFGPYISPQFENLFDGLRSLDVKEMKDPNGGDNVGVGWVTGSIDRKTETRSSSETAYLAPNAGRRNLVVITSALATKVNFAAMKVGGDLVACGVDFIAGNSTAKVYTVHTSGEVVLSGGSINSPQILELSGIGSSSILKPLGIKTLVELPGVGENLQDHPSASIVYKLKGNVGPSTNFLSNATFAAAAAAAYAHQTGILTEAAPILSYLKPSEFMSSEDVKLGHKLMSTPSDDLSASQQKVVLETYKTSPIMEIIALNQNFGVTPENGAVYMGITAAVQHALSRGSLVRLMLLLEHPIGTTAMLPRNQNGVVSPELVVYGTQNLRVIDAGIIPLHISTHIQSAAYAIGEKGAALILASECRS
ncbi:hypothetical protein P7C70_g6541, partial [Phenoliferia sp. Uapishka_3]